MGFFFRDHEPHACNLCGATAELTGEHKIKASELLQEFGAANLTISVSDSSVRPRLAQSARSKHFHFRARICKACNSARTQGPDREFVEFHRSAAAQLDSGKDPSSVFGLTRYAKNSPQYLNVFRYFAKILCCHMAEISAPMPRRLARFAIGQTNSNPVWLAVQEDWTYHQAQKDAGGFQYAAHGGLVVYGHKSSGAATGFHSTLTIGNLQHVFYMNTAWVEQFELKILYPTFHNWCRSQVRIAMETPLSDTEMKRTGLASWK